MRNYKAYREFDGHNDFIREVDISYDNKFIISGSQDESFKIWDVKSGNLIYSEKLSASHFRSDTNIKIQNGICAVTFSPDGKYAAVGTDAQQIHIIKMKDFSTLATLKGHTSSVFYMTYTKNGKYLISGAFRKKLIIWDTKSYKQIQFIEEDKGYNGSFALFGKDKFIANTGNCNINIRRISNGKFIRSIPVQCTLQSVQLTPDEKYMVTCAEDHTVKLYDFKSGEELWCYKNPKPEVADCKISPDGKYLSVATPEGEVLIWKLNELIKN